MGVGVAPLHNPAAAALRAAIAEGLTRGNRAPAPKSKSRTLNASFAKTKKLIFFIGVEPAYTYRPSRVCERSSSTPKNVQVFFTMQLGPRNLRVGPNSCSNRRS